MYECLPPENPLQFLWNVINEGHTFLVKTPTKEPCSVFKICYKNMFSKYLTYIHKVTLSLTLSIPVDVNDFKHTG